MPGKHIRQARPAAAHRHGPGDLLAESASGSKAASRRAFSLT